MGLVLVVALAGCGGDGDVTTVVSTAVEPPQTDGPQLGDRCRADSATGVVEVVTVQGPLTCDEARSVLDAYYGNLENAKGSGAGLRVDDWFCLSTPAVELPHAGDCTVRDTGRKFKMIAIGDSGPAQQPTLAPPSTACGDYTHGSGAGYFDVQATGVDCSTADRVVGEWLDAECGASGPGVPCAIPPGYSCVTEETGLDAAAITCTNGDQVVKFATAA